MNLQKILNWPQKKLGDIATIVGGGTPKTSVKSYWGGDIVWLSPTDLPPIGCIIYVNDSSKKISQVGLKNSSAKLLPKGSVVYSSRASIGKIGICSRELSTNQGFTNFICGKEVLNTYLAYCLRKFTPEIESMSNSTTFKEVNKTAIRNFHIPVPLLLEQKGIVKMLDALMERIEDATFLMNETLNEIGSLRKSFLQNIFGELKYESVSLMKHVDFIGGSQPPKSSFSYEMKDGYVRLIQIRDYKSEKYKVYIRTSSTRKFCNKDDVMIGRYGPPVFQILRGLDGAYNVALMKAVPNESVISKDYLFYFLQNGAIQNYIISISQRSAGQSGVNKDALSKYPISIPPLVEQNKIVNKIRSGINQINELELATEQKLHDLDNLKSSILDSAFKGELTS